MKKRSFLCLCAIAVVIVMITHGISYGHTFTGMIDTKYMGLMLLSGDDGEAYSVLVPEGYPQPRGLEEGNVIRISSHRQAGGVWIVEDIELLSGTEDLSFEISTQELFNLINSGKDYLLIDTRHLSEYRKGHIPTALSAHTMDGQDLREKLARLRQDKETTLIFYSNIMDSATLEGLAREAVSLGYKNIKIYTGGIKRWVKDGYYLVTTLEYIKASLKEEQSFVFVDTRPPEVVKGGHIPKAVNILFEEIMPETIMPYDVADPIVFYGEDVNDRAPHRVALMAANWGYAIRSNHPVMLLSGGFKGWVEAGLEVETGDVPKSVERRPKQELGVIFYEDFKKLWNERQRDKIILDVRTEEEAERIKVSHTVNIPVTELPYRISELPKDKEVIVFCSRGVRALIAYHILKKNGYKVRFLKRGLRIQRDGTLQ